MFKALSRGQGALESLRARALAGYFFKTSVKLSSYWSWKM